MRLSYISENKKIAPRLIQEGYGRTYDIDYDNYHVDPTPDVLSLGRWRSSRGNHLLGGINLNYLTPNQIDRLRRSLSTILRPRTLKQRVQILRRMAPDVFDTAYRTYNRQYINVIDQGTLRFYSPKEEEPGRERPARMPRDTADRIRQRHAQIRGEPEERPEEEPDLEPEEEPSPEAEEPDDQELEEPELEDEEDLEEDEEEL